MSRRAWRVAWGVGAVVFAGYALTAPRTITWWDGAHYPLLAHTLSITNPPGSLLLTLLGWLGTRVRLVAPVAFQFHLIACTFGALAAAAVTLAAARLGAPREDEADGAALVGGAVAGLVFAFSLHPWTYGNQFTPYGLTLAFTGLLLVALLRWWDRARESDARPELFVLAILFGLDVSVHRTNLLWLPAAALTAFVRRPRAWRDRRTWAAAFAGLALGMGLQLAYMPLSLRQPFIDIWEPRTPGALLRFEQLEGLGGGFLIDLWPRKADVVRVQLADWAGFLWRNLGGLEPSRWAGALLALVGVLALGRRSRQLGVAMALCFLTAGLGAVLYFNRPPSYFRSLDRHYLPSWVLLAPWLGVGLAALARGVGRLVPRRVALALVAALCLALVVPALRANAPRCDRSRTRYAETVARDVLELLPRDAILVTNGDNDTFPLWYLQQAESVRRDVLVLNEGLTTLPSTVARLRRADRAFATLQPSDSAIADVFRLNAWRRPLHFAVTLAPSLHAELRQHARLAGLTWHVPAPGDTATTIEPALATLVRERLPRAGLADPRQIRESDELPLLLNYHAAGVQYALALARDGDRAGALATLDLLVRHLPGAPGSAAAEDARQWLAGQRREIASLPAGAP